MDRKTKILIIVIVAIILIVLLIIKIRKNIKPEPEKEKISTTTEYNQEESIYRVVNDETGEILYEGDSEETSYLYQIDSTYQGSNPDSVDEFEIIEENLDIY